MKSYTRTQGQDDTSTRTPLRERSSLNLPRKTEGQVRNLDEKLDRIIKRLDTIETVLASTQQNPELSAVLADFKGEVSLYSEPLNAIKRLYHPRTSINPAHAQKHKISRLIC